MIICEAENIYGINRDSLQLKGKLIYVKDGTHVASLFIVPSTTRNLTYAIHKSLVTSPSELMTTTIFAKNQMSCCNRTFLLIITVIVFVYFID
jgi:hypothetical protein